MNEAGLQIILTAEVDRAIASLSNVNDEFERMGDEAKKALTGAQGALQDLGKGSVSINRLSKALEVFRTASQNATDPKKLQEYNRNIQLLENEIQQLSRSGREMSQSLGSGSGGGAQALTDLGRVASDLPYGFTAIQNNLDPLFGSFSRLFSGANGLAGGFKALGASLLGAGGIGLAFTVVSSLVTTAVQKYGSLGAAIDALFHPLSKAAAAQKLLNDTVLQGAQDAQTNVVALDNLYRAATNANVPLKDRNLIADELQKKYPSIFANLSNEAILAGQAADAYRRVREELVAIATAEAFKDVQVDEAKKRIKLEQDEVKIRQQLLDASFGLAAANERLRNSDTPKFGFKDGAAAVGAYSFQVSKATAALKENALAQGEVIATQEQFAKRQQELAAQFGAAVFGITPDKAKAGKQARDVKSVSDVIKALSDDLTQLDAKLLANGGTLQDLTQDKLKAFGKALGDIKLLGEGPGGNIFDGLLKQIETLRSFVSPPVVSVPITIKPIPTLDKAASNSIGLVLDAFGDSFAPQLNTFTKRLNELVQDTARTGIASLSEAVGTALVTGDMSAIFSSFIGTISGFLSSLGKLLIVQGLALEAFKKSLESFTGIPALIAGAALVAAAGAFKALAAKGGKINSYATGGIVTSPQLALIGDNPGRKEAIVPSEMFDQMGGGGDFVLTTRVSGSDLVFVMQRAGKELKRFN